MADRLCLSMIAKWYGQTFDGKFLRELSYTGHEGVSRAAETILSMHSN
ncbi:MAG: hypothetical protein ACK5UE_00100 [Chitinophagales bacterium]|nr:hypothetical protein [Sphingobacteriales bacterium]